ncbi:hypothetical protein Ciccas_010951, partial [Cichlidogyrus casuarinus]
MTEKLLEKEEDSKVNELHEITSDSQSKATKFVSDFRIEKEKLIFCSHEVEKDDGIQILISEQELELKEDGQTIPHDEEGFIKLTQLINEHLELLLETKVMELVGNYCLMELVVMLILYAFGVYSEKAKSTMTTWLKDLRVVISSIDWINVNRMLNQVLTQINEYSVASPPTHEVYAYFDGMRETLTKLQLYIIMNDKQCIAFDPYNGVDGEFKAYCCDINGEVVRSVNVSFGPDQAPTFKCDNKILKQSEEVGILMDDLFQAICQSNFEDAFKFSHLILLWFLCCLYGKASETLTDDIIKDQIETLIRFLSDTMRLKGEDSYRIVVKMVLFTKKQIDKLLMEGKCDFSSAYLAYDGILRGYLPTDDDHDDDSDKSEIENHFLPPNRMIGFYSEETDGTKEF